MIAGAAAFIDKGWMQPSGGPPSDGPKESGNGYPSSFSVSALDLGGLFEGTRGGG
jgi:hypothetical protein